MAAHLVLRSRPLGPAGAPLRRAPRLYAIVSRRARCCFTVAMSPAGAPSTHSGRTAARSRRRSPIRTCVWRHRPALARHFVAISPLHRRHEDAGVVLRRRPRDLSLSRCDLGSCRCRGGVAAAAVVILYYSSAARRLRSSLSWRSGVPLPRRLPPCCRRPLRSSGCVDSRCQQPGGGCRDRLS